MSNLTWSKAVPHLTMRVQHSFWFPFVESERGDITGPGHQGKESFASSVNFYDQVCTGDADGLGMVCSTNPDDVKWTWVLIDPDRDYLSEVGPYTRDAIPVTCVWGKR